MKDMAIINKRYVSGVVPMIVMKNPYFNASFLRHKINWVTFKRKSMWKIDYVDINYFLDQNCNANDVDIMVFEPCLLLQPPKLWGIKNMVRLTLSLFHSHQMVGHQED